MTDQQTDQNASNQQTTNQNQGAAASWRDSLPEDIRGDKSLADIADVPALAKSFVNSQRLIGRSVRIPGTDAGKDDLDAFYTKLAQVPGVTRLPADEDKAGWDAFYAKLGRPAKADDYKFERPGELPKGVSYNEAAEKGFRELAHSIGLTGNQAKALHAWQMSETLGKADAMAKAADEAAVALKKEWGASYNQRMAAARGVIRQYGGPELAAELDAGLGNNPMLARMLSKIGAELIEDGLVQGDGGSLVPTVSELKEKIAEIRNNREHPYHDPKKAGHREAVDRVNEMYRLIDEAGKAA